MNWQECFLVGVGGGLTVSALVVFWFFVLERLS